MKEILAVFLIALVHFSSGSLSIVGPTQPVLEGETVTLECLVTDSDLNISNVHFERLSRYFHSWYRVLPDISEYSYRRCYLYDVQVQRDQSRLTLSINQASTFSEGPYRCVAEGSNTTAADNASQPLTFKVHYMREPSVYSGRVRSYFTGSVRELRVKQGDDVEVECATTSSEAPEYSWQKEGGEWVLRSAKLKLKSVGKLDGGEYTCLAQHPVVSSLSKRHSISITVLAEDAPWYETSNGRLMMMISAAGAFLLVFTLTVSVFLLRRAKQVKSSKGPIDDHSQKKPIYKASVESLPSNCNDKEPLV